MSATIPTAFRIASSSLPNTSISVPALISPLSPGSTLTFALPRARFPATT